MPTGDPLEDPDPRDDDAELEERAIVAELLVAMGLTGLVL
jgi:hypothetical protein